MNRLVVADIKTPITDGRIIGHWAACARNYYAMFHSQIDTHVAGGPAYMSYISSNLLTLPYDLHMCGETKAVNKLKYFANARYLFRQCNSDIIVVQQGADATFFIACALFYRKKANNKLFLIQYSTVSLQGIFKKSLFAFAKSKIDGIICPNDDVGRAFGLPYCVVPDYIYTAEEQQMHHAEKKYDICILGRIEEEKGIVEAVRALALTSLEVIIAGASSDPLLIENLNSLCNKVDNIHLKTGYISDEAYHSFLEQSRFAVLNYSDGYSSRSSGVVFDMLFHRVPIIGRHCKTMELISENEMGYVYDNIDECDFSAVIKQDNYNRYIRNIEIYLQRNVEYISRLGDFLNIARN